MGDPQPGPVPLYCVPHAGAGTSAFARWPVSLGPLVEPRPVLLPGRCRRRREPRVTTARTLFADLLRMHGPPPTQGPYVLYGHSLGGLVAYSVARALHRAGRPGPSLVVLGACPPPDAAVRLTEAVELPDDELLDILTGFGAVPPEAPAGGIWRRSALGVLRDDLRLAAALRAAADGPLEVPVLAVSGARDALAGPEVMAGWRRWATGAFAERTVPGDHFFVRDAELPRLLGRACRVVLRNTAMEGSR